MGGDRGDHDGATAAKPEAAMSRMLQPRGHLLEPAMPFVTTVFFLLEPEKIEVMTCARRATTSNKKSYKRCNFLLELHSGFRELLRRLHQRCNRGAQWQRSCHRRAAVPRPAAATHDCCKGQGGSVGELLPACSGAATSSSKMRASTAATEGGERRRRASTARQLWGASSA